MQKFPINKANKEIQKRLLVKLSFFIKTIQKWENRFLA